MRRGDKKIIPCKIKSIATTDMTLPTEVQGMVIYPQRLPSGVYCVISMSCLLWHTNLRKIFMMAMIDDPDACDGTVFNRWYSDMCHKGIAIDWEDMI